MFLADFLEFRLKKCKKFLADSCCFNDTCFTSETIILKKISKIKDIFAKIFEQQNLKSDFPIIFYHQNRTRHFFLIHALQTPVKYIENTRQSPLSPNTYAPRNMECKIKKFQSHSKILQCKQELEQIIMKLFTSCEHKKHLATEQTTLKRLRRQTNNRAIKQSETFEKPNNFRGFC